MKNIRRSSAAVATVATLALALTACSSGGTSSEEPKNGESSSADGSELIGDAQSKGAMEDFEVGTTFKATEPLEFGLTYRDHTNYPVKDDWSIFTNLKNNQNVSFKRTDIPIADWDAKRSLLLGSGNFPDITTVFYPGSEQPFIASGALLPVSKYLDYMPNFQDKVEKWGLQEELDTRRAEDGEFYLLPGLREQPDVQYTLCTNDDLWAKAGITEDPATWDEFVEDLKKVKEANPELKYPYSERWNETPGPLGALLKTISPNYGTVAGWDYSATVFNEDDKKFELTAGSQGYKEVVTYLAGLVKDGLLDPEITQKDDLATQKFLNGESATVGCNTQTITSDIRDKAKDLGKDLKTHLMVIPGGPAGNVIAGSRLAQGIVLNADVAEKPYFKALLQFVDWLYYSDEGIEFAVWGVDGETYTKDASGKRVLNADINGHNQNPDATKKIQADYGYYNGVFMAGTGSTKDLVLSTMNPEIADWTNTVLENSELRPVNPRTPFSATELEQLGLIETQVKDAVNAATAEFVTGKRDIADFDKFLAEIDAQGGSQIVQLYNDAYARN